MIGIRQGYQTILNGLLASRGGRVPIRYFGFGNCIADWVIAGIVLLKIAKGAGIVIGTIQGERLVCGAAICVEFNRDAWGGDITWDVQPLFLNSHISCCWRGFWCWYILVG